MNHIPKLLLLDIDGTLVRSKPDAVPTVRLIEAVRRAQRITNIALATGRSFRNAKPIIDAFDCLKGPGVFNGGSDIIDIASGVIIFRQTIPIAHLRELVKLAIPFGYDMYTDADHYTAKLQSPNEIQSEAAQFFVEAVKATDAVRLVEVFGSVRGVGAHLASSWVDGEVFDIHVTHEHASKRHGVERVMHMLGINPRVVMAIGDGYNDVPMLEASGFKVVMGDAPEQVRAIADYIAPSLDEDGAADAIERFICDTASGH